MKALIFDVDGTLAETEELHRLAFNGAFSKAGFDWNWTRQVYHRLLMTTGGKERIHRYAAEIGAQAVDAAALHREKTAIFVRLIAEGRISLRPGIAALIGEARGEGLALAVATTTSPENIEALSRAVFGRAATQVFDVIAAGDMVAAKKPAPDVYELALRELGLVAGQAVAFEDSANGVRAARAAGVPVVLSRGLYTMDETIAGATVEVASFADLGGLSGLRQVLEVAQYVR